MNILLVTGGRTGSSLLNAYLRQLGVGKPQAWLDTKFFGEDYTLQEIHTFLETKRKNDILAVKASWWYFLQICEKLEITLKELLDVCLPNPKVIYQIRRDRVHQGLSRVKHLMHQKSHVYNDDQMKDYQKAENNLMAVDVPINQIREQMLANCYGHIAYQMFFERFEIVPYILAFEDFIADKVGTCRDILDWLGIEYPEDVELKDEYLSTHSPINDKWQQAFLQRQLEII